MLQRIGRRCRNKDDPPAMYNKSEKNAAVRWWRHVRLVSAYVSEPKTEDNYPI